MKKLIFFLVMSFISLGVSSKNYKLVMAEPIRNENCIYNDWSVVISFEWSEYKNYGVTVIVKNESDSRIYIEWENARIDDEPICFGNDNLLSYKDRKPDEIVHAGSQSKRFIARQSEFEYDGRKLFYLKNLDVYGETGRRTLIIPIRIGDEIKDYRFALAVKVQ